MRGHTRQGDGGERHKKHGHADALHELRPEYVPKAHLRGEFAAPEKAARIHGKADGHQPAHIQPVAEFTNQRRQQHRENADGRGGQPRPGGGVAQLRLQHQRQQYNGAHIHHKRQTQRQHAHGEIAVLKQAQVHNRVLGVQLPHDKIAQAHQRHHRQSDDFGRRKPIQLFAAVEHHLQSAHAHHQQRQADAVDGHAGNVGFAVFELAPRHPRGGNADGDVDKENPAPMPVVADDAAQNRAENRCHDDGHRPQRQGHGAFLRRISGHQQALRQGNHRPGHRALHNAKHHQQFQAGGDAAQKRRHHKQQGGAHKHLHFAVALGQPAGERHGNGVGHRKRGNHPSALAGGRAQITGNGGQGHIGNGGIEHLHKNRHRQGQRHQHQRQAF